MENHGLGSWVTPFLPLVLELCLAQRWTGAGNMGMRYFLCVCMVYRQCTGPSYLVECRTSWQLIATPLVHAPSFDLMVPKPGVSGCLRRWE